MPSKYGQQNIFVMDIWQPDILASGHFALGYLATGHFALGILATGHFYPRNFGNQTFCWILPSYTRQPDIFALGYLATGHFAIWNFGNLTFCLRIFWQVEYCLCKSEGPGDIIGRIFSPPYVSFYNF